MSFFIYDNEFLLGLCLFIFFFTLYNVSKDKMNEMLLEESNLILKEFNTFYNVKLKDIEKLVSLFNLFKTISWDFFKLVYISINLLNNHNLVNKNNVFNIFNLVFNDLFLKFKQLQNNFVTAFHLFFHNLLLNFNQIFVNNNQFFLNNLKMLVNNKKMDNNTVKLPELLLLHYKKNYAS